MIIVGDIGSCHYGNLQNCKDAISLAKEHGIDYLKFQLFGEEHAKNGNIVFPEPWEENWVELVRYARLAEQKITASVFCDRAVGMLLEERPDFVKFGYSQKHRTDWQRDFVARGVPVVVTCDVMTQDVPIPEAKKLWTVTTHGQTVYPVHHEIRFGNLFDTFYGFSDHTYHDNRNAFMAVGMGAKMVEFHISFPIARTKCPDETFAWRGEKVEEYVRSLR